MKIGRILVLLALVIGLMAGPWQAPAEAIMLGRVQQIKNLYYTAPNWYEILPDGTTQLFTLAQGQSFIMTGVYIRFYANNPDTGPYRFYLMRNSTRMYILNLSNVNSGTTVWGGASTDILDPGVPFSVIPTPQVQQMPAPPANPNSGPVISGTFYLMVKGYVFP